MNTMPNGLSEWSSWCSIISFIWAVAASYAAWWQRHQRLEEHKNVVYFLHGLKTGVLKDQTEMRIQIDDTLARLDPPKNKPNK